MATLQSLASASCIPGPQDKVYKDECFFSFDNPVRTWKNLGRNFVKSFHNIFCNDDYKFLSDFSVKMHSFLCRNDLTKFLDFCELDSKFQFEPNLVRNNFDFHRFCSIKIDQILILHIFERPKISYLNFFCPWELSKYAFSPFSHGENLKFDQIWVAKILIFVKIVFLDFLIFAIFTF